jgi:hypothetical protein
MLCEAFNEVFHQACGLAGFCQNDPRLSLEVNINWNVCVGAGIKKLVAALSSSVYGEVDLIKNIDYIVWPQ